MWILPDLAPWCRPDVNQFVCRWGRRCTCACIWLAWGLWGLALALPAWAQPDASVEVVRTDTGVHVDFKVPFELSPAVEAALQKGVVLHFVAETQVFRERWYWRDLRVAGALRTWRLSYQPLTRQYRVSLGVLTQYFDSLSEALASLQRVSRWTVAEPADLAASGHYRLQFSYQLDTSQLPRPLQIGIGGQSDWALFIQKKMPLPPLSEGE